LIVMNLTAKIMEVDGYIDEEILVGDSGHRRLAVLLFLRPV
jgi:hypothetical protein